MTPRELIGDFQRLDNRIKAVQKASQSDESTGEVISLSMSFLCVDVCGRLEQNLKSVFSTFGSRKSNRVLDKSISKLVSYYQNPMPSKLVELTSFFDDELADWLKKSWAENGDLHVAGQRLANLVGDRIILAHSKKTSHNITMAKLKNYFEEYKELISFLTFYFLNEKVFETNKYQSRLSRAARASSVSVKAESRAVKRSRSSGLGAGISS